MIQEINDYLKAYGDCKERITNTIVSIDTIKEET